MAYNTVAVGGRRAAHGHGEVGSSSTLHVQVTTQPHAVDVLTIRQSDALQLHETKTEGLKMVH